MIVVVMPCSDPSMHCHKCGSGGPLSQYGIYTGPDFETRALNGWFCCEECAQIANTITITDYAQRLAHAANMARMVSSATRSLNARARERAKTVYMSPEAREARARDRERIRAEYEDRARAEAKVQTERQNAERARYMAEHANDPPAPLPGVPNMIPKIKW